MAIEMDDTTLTAVSELGVPDNPPSPAPKDVTGKKDSDHFVLGLNVNASVSQGEVTMGNTQVVVQNEIHVSLGSKDIVSKEGDGLREVLEPTYSQEVNGSSPDSAEYTERCNYSVGDLVWGKIKSFPWWPGQICAPCDASEDALKLNQEGRHLVAFYGDASFAWCFPSRLIPFAEHFRGMSEQSSSKTFVKGVQQAVDEIGRLVELELTCSCVPDENQMGLTRPLAVNAGIKSGVFMPEGDIGKLLSFRYDPSELLMTVSSIAQSVSFASSLELSILRGWLSAFYRAKGGFTLPVYNEPLFVIGLEGSVEEQNDLSIPIEVPPQGSPKDGWVSRDSVGLTKGANVMIPKGGRNKRVTKDIVNRKRKSGNRVQDRKEKDENLKADNGVVGKEEMQDRCLSIEPSEPDIPIGESNYSEGSKEGYDEEMCSTRPRRKSKYLSPPFTNHDQTENTGTKKRKEELSASNIISRAEKSYTPKRARAAAKEEGNCIGLEKNASLTSSLVLTVPPESSLPSKYEIIRKFSEYGHVNEEETVVFSNHCRVKIVHESSAGVEAALRDLLRGNPFGSKTVDYKILYSSAASVGVASGSAAPVGVASDSAALVGISLDSAAPVGIALDSAAPVGMPHLGSNGQT